MFLIGCIEIDQRNSSFYLLKSDLDEMEIQNRKAPNIIKLVQKYALPAFVMSLITLGYIFAVTILNSAMFSYSGVLYYLNFILISFEYYLLSSTYYKIVTTSPGNFVF